MPSILSVPLPRDGKLEIAHVRLIVRLFLFRQVSFFRNMNSEKLKNILEDFARPLFDASQNFTISENILIEAMVKEGYRAKRINESSSNFVFNLDPKSLNNLQKIRKNLSTHYQPFEETFAKGAYDETGKRRVVRRHKTG